MMVDIELGDGQGNVQAPGIDLLWCRTLDRGRLLRMHWWSDEPVPPEGTRVTAEWRDGLLHYPRYPTRAERPEE